MFALKRVEKLYQFPSRQWNIFFIFLDSQLHMLSSCVCNWLSKFFFQRQAVEISVVNFPWSYIFYVELVLKARVHSNII